MTDFSENFALEIAMSIEPPEIVRTRYGVDHDEWERLQSDQVFRDAVENYQIKARLSGKVAQITARLMVERSITTLYSIVSGDDPKAAIDAYRELAKLAEGAPGQAGGQSNDTADTSEMRTIGFFTPKESMVESVPKVIAEDTPETIGWMPSDS